MHYLENRCSQQKEFETTFVALIRIYDFYIQHFSESVLLKNLHRIMITKSLPKNYVSTKFTQTWAKISYTNIGRLNNKSGLSWHLYKRIQS